MVNGMLYICYMSLAVAVAIHHYLSLVILLLYAQEALLSSLFSLLSSLSLSLSLSLVSMCPLLGGCSLLVCLLFRSSCACSAICTEGAKVHGNNLSPVE